MVTRYLGPALFLGVALAGPATLAQSTTPTFIEGAAFSTGTKVPTATVTLTGAVAQGNLLVGWFAQYGDPAQVRVSDNVNGTWTRAPRSLTFLDDTGDIALYYRENTQAAPGGVTITASVSSNAYLLGSVADYSGIALAGSLDEIASARDLGTAVDSGATAAVGAGELVFAALVSGGAAGSVTPGSSLGVPYTPRAQTSNASAYEEDITSSAAGGQHGTATLASSTDWYAVCAVFHPRPATASPQPSAPTGLEATSVASTRVALSWSPSSGGVAGYAVYRDGSPIGTTRPDTTTFMDEDVTGSTTYTYSVDAFDLANDHSAPSAPLTVTTPATSGLVTTASASASAYLQEAVADFRGVAAVGALDQTMVAQGQGSSASVGPTASVPAGELVVAAVLTGGQPGWVLPGSSQRVPYVLDVQNGSAASDLEDILSSAAGPQEGSLTLGTGTNWNMVLATFRPASTTTTTTTQPVTTTTTTTRPPSTSSTTSTSTTQPPTSTTQPPTTTTTSTTTQPPTTITQPPTTTTTTTTTTQPPTTTTQPPTT